MSSERQIAANRINGAKSCGPVTPEGKAASRRSLGNSRHGLLARTLVIEGESRDRFIELLVSLQEEFEPATPTECALVENMVAARWRQLRLWSVESASLQQELTSQAESNAHLATTTRAGIAYRSLSEHTERFNRYETRFDRQYDRAVERLFKLRVARQQKSKSTILPIEPNLS
jgi:hypothetical protein